MRGWLLLIMTSIPGVCECMRVCVSRISTYVALTYAYMLAWPYVYYIWITCGTSKLSGAALFCLITSWKKCIILPTIRWTHNSCVCVCVCLHMNAQSMYMYRTLAHQQLCSHDTKLQWNKPISLKGILRIRFKNWVSCKRRNFMLSPVQHF